MLTQGTWFALPDVRGNVLVMGKARRDRVWPLALPSRAFNELFIPASSPPGPSFRRQTSCTCPYFFPWLSLTQAPTL